MAQAILLIGTRKGLMIARSTNDRQTWAVDDFQFLNQEVYSVALDTRRDPPRILAGVGTGHWGPLLTYSDDLGKSWTEPEEPPIGFPEGTDASVARVWQIQPGTDLQPDVVYAGVEPHALFRSDDGGQSFSLVEGLWNHPHRPSWIPGGGGACLHTVLPHPTDPDDLLVAMSAAGVYRTRDGGASWRPANEESRRRSSLRISVFPSSGSASTRWHSTLTSRSACSLRTISASIAVRTAAIPGCRSNPACRATSASRWLPIHIDPIPSTRFRSRLMPNGFLRRPGCAFTGRRTPARHGSLLEGTARGSLLRSSASGRDGRRSRRPRRGLFRHQAW